MPVVATSSPSDQDLRTAVISLKSAHPTLGIAKIHALLLAGYPDWIVSEKRTKKILQSEGLTLQTSQSTAEATLTSPSPTKHSKASGSGTVNVYPSSKLIPNLEISKYNAKIEVKHFNKKKGKGLVAKEKILAGTPLWKEDPYIVAAEWEIYDLQQSGQACSFCTTPFTSTITTSLITSCSASCHARFCNRLCRDRSARTHPLLCPVQNPASIPLLRWARKTEWMALHALACMTSRVVTLCQNTKDPKDAIVAEEEWRIVSSFATLSIEDRAKYHFRESRNEPDSESWRMAFNLYMQAFKEPPTPPDQKKLEKLIKNPLRADITQGLFQYDAFLKNLGKMSLNLEAHGGLYVLHSHLNHSCQPNVSIRHLDQRSALFRITAISLKDIEPGEELFITYVNPTMSVEQRRDELEQWGFGRCECARCVKEEREELEAKSHIVGEGGDEDLFKFSQADLERELKIGLGVM
ncbi:hypothetical protein DFH05DRAFT_1498352 [Lentinula detonsa]|uniref:Histone-lysine N-methyltransferase SET5 n=1 Tax=Lentinula detonsa TaxID=2804962 RepID=A0A9W8TWF8_9AGAR|nr:hypothetical protein DFH05DRAFT_1498352 [Lentinula detonsa]KAJ3981289.1 hypothetical protein F5890DRAFT_1417974 [Lentinula detonsa]